MLEKILHVFRMKDLRKKIFFVFGMLVIFRLAAAIPIPGIDLEKLKSFFENNQFFGMINIFTGGALDHLSIAMLGLGPYITATIILQLLTMIFPRLKEMQQEAGEKGQQRFNQYARIATIPLAMLQAYAFLMLFRRQGIILSLTPLQILTNIVTITAGSILLMWLGELITERGIGNGVSLLIFAGIVARLPSQVGQTIMTWDPTKIFSYLIFIIVAFLVIGGVVFITEAQKNIPVSYAKRIRGHRMYGGSSTYLPIRVNQAGVIPIIFAISILLFPGMIGNFLSGTKTPWLASFAKNLTSLTENQIIYGIAYFLLVVIFTYFYTAVTFDPKNIAENLQKNGGFVPGIRPGEATSRYLNYIISRITLIGAIFLGTIAVAPMVIQNATGVKTFNIGGTAILIIVSVVLETVRQFNAQLVMRDYEAF